MGISMVPTPGFVAEIDVCVKGHPAFTAPVVFIDTDFPVLLGQEGFFDNHRIKFEKDHDTFEISAPPTK